MEFGVGVIGATGYIGTPYRQEIRESSGNIKIIALCARRRDLLEAAAKADPAGPAARLTAPLPPTVYLVNRGELAEATALGLARSLRQAGVAVELDGSGAAFGKQFKRADRCGAPWALVLGDGEAEQGQLRLKPLLGDGEEQTLAWADPSTDLPPLLAALQRR